MEHEVDALEEYRRAMAAMERARLELEAATELRREAVGRLYGQGLTITELSRLLGLPRAGWDNSSSSGPARTVVP